ncbi:MAG: DUF3363 domain-containing protein [Myxococcales bacterium]
MKARIVRMGHHGVKAARLHLSYIERDGVDRDGSPGRLYGADGEFARAALSEPIRGERHQFRFIVSPEDDIDLTTFTRDLMSRVEADLGMRLRWGAVNHYDTDNPHAHVVVRGVDKSGREVRIDRAYISERMRWRAQNLLTEELGPRLGHEVQSRLDREVSQERLTSIDRRLAGLVGADRTIDLAKISRACGDHERRRVVGRLQVLQTLRMADRTTRGCWRLAPDWQNDLRELGERDDIIKRIDRAIDGEAPRERYEIVDGRAERQMFEGVVRRKGLHDELRGDAYAVIETADGRAAYTRIDSAAAEALTEGSIARVSVERQTWNKPMDRVLEQVARENDGVYDARLHLTQLQARPVTVEGRDVRPEEVVAANVRRLARLERHQLVTRLEDGRWRVPQSLVRQLQERDVSHPRYALRAETVAPSLREQITRRAPTWLDVQEPSAPRAFYGFGSTRATAMQQRDRFLLQIGIPVEPPSERIRALAELERFEVATKLARNQGVTPLASPLEGMRGQLLACGHSSDGRPLACVLDALNRRLVVVAAPPDLALDGRRVTITRDAKGQLLMWRDGLGLGRG